MTKRELAQLGHDALRLASTPLAEDRQVVLRAMEMFESALRTSETDDPGRDYQTGWDNAVAACISIIEQRRSRPIIEFETPLKDCIGRMRQLIGVKKS